MEVVSAVASIAQLAAYTRCAAQALAKLSKELRDCPSSWQEQSSDIEHLIKIFERISSASQQVGKEASQQIATLVSNLNETAIRTLRLIRRARSPGILGIRWQLIGGSNAIDQAFQSLRTKTEILQLLLSGAILANSANSRPNLRVERVAMSRRIEGIEPTHATVDIEMAASLTLDRIEIGDCSSTASQNGWGEFFKFQNGWEQLVKSRGQVKIGGVKSGKYAADHSNNFDPLNAAHHQEQMNFCERMREKERIDGNLEGEDFTSSPTVLDQRLHHLVGACVVHERTAIFRADSGPNATSQTAPNERLERPQQPRLHPDVRSGRITSSASRDSYGDLMKDSDRFGDRSGGRVRERDNRGPHVARRAQDSTRSDARYDDFEKAGRRI